MTDDQDVPAGWYVDVRNRDRERYWTGAGWRDGDRWRRSRTPQFPGSSESSVGKLSSEPSAGVGAQAFSPWAVFIVVLAGLSAVGSIVVGAVLISHAGQDCDSVCSTTHPYTGAGVAVIIGGLLEAAFIASFAALHQEMQTLRRQLTRIGDKLDAA